MLSIRRATRADAPIIAGLVRELAEYEKLLPDARATPADFARELDAPNPVIHVLIAEWNGADDEDGDEYEHEQDPEAGHPGAVAHVCPDEGAQRRPVVAAQDCRHDARTRGSMNGYSRSATRFISTTPAENTRKRPCSSGKSGPRNACADSSPRPGQENTVSTVIAPVTTKPGGTLRMESPWLIQTRL